MRSIAWFFTLLVVVCTVGAACSDGAQGEPEPVAADGGARTGSIDLFARDAGVDARGAADAAAEAGSPDAGTPPSANPSSGIVEYASVATLDLPGLGLPETLTLADLTIVSGQADSLTVREGQIRFLTPSDPGIDGEVVFKAKLGNKDLTLPITIKSARPTEVAAFIEPAEGVATAAPPALKVTGLGATNAFVGGGLTFSADGAPALDPLASSGTIFVPQTGALIDLAKMWTYTSATHSLTIDATKMGTLLTTLPAADVEVDISMTSLDGEFAFAWSFVAHKPTATIHGRVVGVGGAPTAVLAGHKMAIRGLDNHTRRVVTVNPDGTFSADALVEGTYDITLLDVDTPEFWKATVPIFAGSTTVNLDFTYAGTLSSPKSVGGVMKGFALPLRSRTQQDGTPPPSRIAGLPPTEPSGGASPDTATPATCETAKANGFVYVAQAAAQNVTVSCLTNAVIPKGTQNVSVKLDVATAEYPTYTTAKSQYNDSWSYAVSGAPGLGGASGSVNDTHYTQGSITKEVCIDTSTLAQAADWPLVANLAATNIGDAALATTVTMTVTLGCESKLSVTKALFTSPSADGFRLIRPSAPSNIVDNYFSVPINTVPTSSGIPLTVLYAPKTAAITKVRLGVMVSGAPVMATADLSSQLTTRAPGVLTFGELLVPSFPTAKFAGKTNVVVELTGTVDGATEVSKPETGVVSFASQQTFIPLFLAGDVFDAARRYGVRDVDGDSWSTAPTIDWLSSKSYRFDDTSAVHALQTGTGRSALDHAGHSDGTQIDLRYADGQGGFTDKLGGANNGDQIKAMLTAAQVEAAGTGAKPTVAQAVAWITANRAMLESEAAAARRLYAGPSWMKLALFDGKFPDGTAVPNVTSWATKPAMLGFVAPHLHHWHMSLKGN